jgi:peptide/nickel transport system permease protein
MRGYILRRLAQSVLVVFAVTTIMFFMFRVMPADPTAMMVERGMSEEARQALLERWGLTGSLWDQYVRYMGNLLVGDFGNSFFYRSRSGTCSADDRQHALDRGARALLGALIGALWE